MEDGDNNPVEEVIPAIDEKTPCFRNIYISNIACNGARRAMYFNGLPEMPITNINVTNANITSELGVELCESDGVKLSNVKVNVAKGAALKLTNVKNTSVAGLEHSGNASHGTVVTGKRTENIAITSKSIAAAENLVKVATPEAVKISAE